MEISPTHLWRSLLWTGLFQLWSRLIISSQKAADLINIQLLFFSEEKKKTFDTLVEKSFLNQPFKINHFVSICCRSYQASNINLCQMKINHDNNHSVAFHFSWLHFDGTRHRDIMDLRQDFDQQRDVYINKMLLIIKVIMMMRMTKVMMMMMPSVSLRLERRQQRCTGALQDDTCQKLFESFLFNNN